MSGTHWAATYIGEPWIAQYHDCWAFFRRVQAERFGLDLPEIDVDACAPLACRRAFASHEERERWMLVEDAAREGDAVLMGKNARPAHVGLWVAIDGGMVLHCVEHMGVVLQGRQGLKLAGWNILGIYRRRP